MLEEIEKSLQEITQGEWEYKFFNSVFWIPEIASIKRKSDAKFIASAPRWLRWCLEELKQEEAERKEYASHTLEYLDKYKETQKENQSLRKVIQYMKDDKEVMQNEIDVLRKEVERLREQIQQIHDMPEGIHFMNIKHEEHPE